MTSVNSRVSRRLLIVAMFVAWSTLPTMEASQPAVTVIGLPKDGVNLVPSTKAVFVAKFGRAPEPGYDGLLPFTAVIENDTDQEIVAYSVEWICTDGQAKVTRGSRKVMDFSTLDSGTHLVSHSTEVVSLSTGLEGGGQTWNPGLEQAIEQDVRRFANQVTVRIALDAVLFADGSIVGTDHAHSVLLWRADLDARREVYPSVASAGLDDRGRVIEVFSADTVQARNRPLESYFSS